MSQKIPTPADFDLERVMDLFDRALTSKDERVVNALRSLLMIVALTAPEGEDNGLMDNYRGPFRQLHEEINNLHRRIRELEQRTAQQPPQTPYNPYPNGYPGGTTWGGYGAVPPSSVTLATGGYETLTADEKAVILDYRNNSTTTI